MSSVIGVRVTHINERKLAPCHHITGSAEILTLESLSGPQTSTLISWILSLMLVRYRFSMALWEFFLGGSSRLAAEEEGEALAVARSPGGGAARRQFTDRHAVCVDEQGEPGGDQGRHGHRSAGQHLGRHCGVDHR